MIFAREQGFAFQHLGEDASRAPDVDLHVVLLPREHNLRRAIVPRRDVSRHLRVLDAGEAEITNLEIAIFVDQNIAGLEVPMDHPGGMDILEAALLPSVLMRCIRVHDRSAHTKI